MRTPRRMCRQLRSSVVDRNYLGQRKFNRLRSYSVVDDIIPKIKRLDGTLRKEVIESIDEVIQKAISNAISAFRGFSKELANTKIETKVGTVIADVASWNDLEYDSSRGCIKSRADIVIDWGDAEEEDFDSYDWRVGLIAGYNGLTYDPETNIFKYYIRDDIFGKM